MGSPTAIFCPHSNSSNRSESMDDKLTTSSTLQQETTLGLTSTSVIPCSEILTTAAETNLSIDTSSHLMDFVPRGLSSDKSDSTGSHTPPPLTCSHHLLQPDMPKKLTTTPKRISKRQLFRNPDCVATPRKSPHGNSSSGRPSTDVQFKNDSGDSNNRILSVLHEEVMYGGNVIIPEQHKDNLNCNYGKIKDDSCTEFEHNVLCTPPKQIIRNVNNVCMGAPRKSSRRSYSKVKGFSSVCRKLEF